MNQMTLPAPERARWRLTPKTRKRLVLGLVAAAVLAAVVYGFLPEPLPVQTAPVERGPLRVLVEEEGETQVRDRYVVTAPIAAFARRITLEAGDAVQAGQALVELEPPRVPLLDARTRDEAQARLEMARAGVARAERQVEGAEALAARAEAERARLEPLAADQVVTPQALDLATTDAQRAAAELEAARAAAAAARAEVRALEATLRGGGAGPVQAVVRAPVAGRVLAVHRESEGMVAPGEPLVEVGDPGRLEIRVDVLSQDAVRLLPGTRVLVDQWGGDAELEAEVVRVNPDGFTRVSSLGVEEQRVTVTAALAGGREAPAGLGSGFRVLARFVVWEAPDALQVPAAAAFRTADGWGVFVVEDGRAVLRRIDVGRQAGLFVEVRGGLGEGETVIVHPDNDLTEGMRVRPR